MFSCLSSRSCRKNLSFKSGKVSEVLRKPGAGNSGDGSLRIRPLLGSADTGARSDLAAVCDALRGRCWKPMDIHPVPLAQQDRIAIRSTWMRKPHGSIRCGGCYGSLATDPDRSGGAGVMELIETDVVIPSVVREMFHQVCRSVHWNLACESWMKSNREGATPTPLQQCLQVGVISKEVVSPRGSTISQCPTR